MALDHITNTVMWELGLICHGAGQSRQINLDAPPGRFSAVLPYQARQRFHGHPRSATEFDRAGYHVIVCQALAFRI